MSFLRTETKILTEFNVILKNGEKPDFTTDKEIEKFILEEINNIEKIEIKSHKKEILKEDFRLIAIASLSKNFIYENEEISFVKKGNSISVESFAHYTKTKFKVNDFFENLVTFQRFYRYECKEERKRADVLATVLKLFALAVRNEADYSIDIKSFDDCGEQFFFVNKTNRYNEQDCTLIINRGFTAKIETLENKKVLTEFQFVDGGPEMYSPFNKVVRKFLDPYYNGMQGCIKYSIGKNYVKYYPKEDEYEIFVDEENVWYETGKEKKNLVFETAKSEKNINKFFRELEKEEGIMNPYEIVSALYNIFRYAEKYEHISDDSLITYRRWFESLKQEV